LGKYDTLSTSGLSATTVSVRLQIPFAYAKKHQQAFLAPLPGTGVIIMSEPSSPMYPFVFTFLFFLLFSNGATHNLATFCSQGRVRRTTTIIKANHSF
jgi:hypothetical protein